MNRPAGRHLRLAERAAYDIGARAVEWKNGKRHWQMRITLPSGQVITHQVARRLCSTYQENLPNWIEQRMRLEMRRERGAA
jgi:hypothetical protein